MPGSCRKLKSQFERLRRTNRRLFFIIGGRCFAIWAKARSENLIVWWKSPAPWLAQALADGTYRHWLALGRSGCVAGGGGVLLCPWPANPKEPCTERAVILNVYTEPEFRRRGVARLIMQAILGWVKGRGLRSVNLHASDEGRPLYEKLGFMATNEMRLRFDP